MLSRETPREYLSAYALIFTGLFLTHLPLLRLPYFWDEAGYFIPAARDLMLTGSLVPHTTLSNAHPPLVMIWLAFWWKFSAFTPAVTRISMLLVAAFALLGLWRLSRDVAGAELTGPPRHDGCRADALGAGDVCGAQAGGDDRVLRTRAAGEGDGNHRSYGAVRVGVGLSAAGEIARRVSVSVPARHVAEFIAPAVHGSVGGLAALPSPSHRLLPWQS